MAELQVNQDLLNLIFNFKPFVGNRGKALIDATHSVAKLLTTEHASQAVSLLRTLSSSEGLPDSSSPEADTETEKPLQLLSKFPHQDNIAFVLFLILILLLFANSRSHYFQSEDNQA